MKKILIIHHGEGVGGGLIALLGLIEELKTRYVVEVFCIFNSSAVAHIERTGVKTILAQSYFYQKMYRLFLHSDASYFNLLDFFRGIKNFATYFLSKYWFAKRELNKLSSKYELVYLNSTFISDWALAAQSVNAKVIIHIREPLSKGIFGLRYSIIRNTIDKYCDWIIAISKDNSDRVGLRHKTSVVYDPVVMKNRTEEKSLVLDDNKKYFLYLGGMQRIKGYEQLVEALPYLAPNVRIFFLGGSYNVPKNGIKRFIRYLLDPFQWKTASLTKKLKQSPHIIDIGLVDQVFDYYMNSLAVISPFAKPHASLPILEAFSVGRPVIVSNVKGMDELVSSANGYFFENHNFKELAMTINRLAELHSLAYQKMSSSAKDTYLELQNHDSVSRIIECILKGSNI